MPALRVSNRIFIFILCVISVFVAYFGAKGVNYLLDPGTIVPARPSSADVAPAELPALESGGPAAVPALANPETPIFYVAAPRDDGTVVELTLDADADYVDPLPEHVLKVLVSLHGGIGKTPRMTAPDGQPLPEGYYRLTVRHRDENLVDKRVFIGSSVAPGPEYEARMKKHHANLRARAAREAGQIESVTASVEKHLKTQPRGNIAKWQDLMRKTRAELNRTREEHKPVFYERAYERLNKILRETDAVEKERERIAALKKRDEDRERLTNLQAELARAELKRLREDAGRARAEQADDARLFERKAF